METDCKYLLIYGSLLDAANEFGAYLLKHSTHVNPGYFHGLLYDMGEYPGAIYNPAAETKVWGEVRSLTKPAEALKIIDEYEGYGPHEVQPNLFIREVIAIQTETCAMACWVYLYNLPVDGFRLITSGRYN